MATGYTRRKELICTLEEHNANSSKILLNGEVLWVLQSDGRYGLKVGDGVTNIGNLDYSVNYSDINALKSDVESLVESASTSEQNAKSSETECLRIESELTALETNASSAFSDAGLL